MKHATKPLKVDEEEPDSGELWRNFRKFHKNCFYICLHQQDNNLKLFFTRLRFVCFKLLSNLFTKNIYISLTNNNAHCLQHIINAITYYIFEPCPWPADLTWLTGKMQSNSIRPCFLKSSAPYRFTGCPKKSRRMLLEPQCRCTGSISSGWHP